MATVLLTATSASPQTWVPPKDCPPGVSVQIEAWGSASGGSGGSTSFRAGGAGGAWASTNYTITAADVAGIAYTIQNGSAGTAAANSLVGPDASFGTAPRNIIPNSGNYGGAVGTLPLGWTTSTGGLTVSVVGVGHDAPTGLDYTDVSFSGTTTGTAFGIIMTAINSSTNVPISPSLNYITSGYLYVTAGSLANTTALSFQLNGSTATNVFVNAWNSYFQSASPVVLSTTSLTRIIGNAITPTSTVAMGSPLFMVFNSAAGAAINFTLRIAGFQVEQASSVSAYQSTPTSYVLAKGGGAPSGTTGGTASNAGLSFGLRSFAGGAGATRTQGGGGGGSAGKVGAGAGATTATGGTADAGSGGTAGVSNVEGGGGGTAATSSAPGGAPSGGGGANTSTGSGGTGGRAQLRITYTPTSYGPATKPWRQRHMLTR